MNVIKKVTQQTSWQLLGKVITSFSTVLILGIVTRNYGEAGTGLFTLALTYLGFFYLAADFGVNAFILPRLLHNEKSEWQNLFGFRLGWSVILIILALAFLPFLPFSTPEFTKTVWFGTLAILGNAIFVTTNALFQRHLHYNFSIIASSLGALLFLLVGMYFARNHYPLEYLITANMLGWMFCAGVSLFFVRRFVPLRPTINWDFIKSIFVKGWPLSLTLVLNVVYFRLDTFILGSYRGLEEVGVYNLAYQIFQTALVVPTFIMNSYYPIMLEQLEARQETFKKSLLVGLGMLGSLGVLGTIMTLVFSPFVIDLLSGGKGFEGSSLALRILSLSFPAFFLSSLLMWTLISLKQYKTVVLIYAIGLAINGILNFIFIPSAGFFAASWITVFCEYLILTLQIGLLVPVLSRRNS